jgi:paraquat-inducible protein A
MRRPAISFGFRGRSASAAFAIAAAAMLIPANALPVLTTATSGRTRNDTILSGIVELWKHGLGAIAVVVFAASIVIPFLKLAGLAWLIYGVRNGPPANGRSFTRIYASLDFIGRWSMLDVFLAAFLTGLVQFGGLALVQARAGIVAFASAVVLTVLATRAFDPRCIWDQRRTPTP